jgi:hypothetical protein
MPDVFISFSTKDQPLADVVYRHLKAEGIDAFMSAASLQPGQRWTDEIRNALRNSKTVVLLASRAACESAYVLQEVGGAFFAEGKTIIPIIWDIEPESLPGWMGQYHALDLRKMPDASGLGNALSQIANRIKSEKLKGLAVVAGILYLLSKL